MKFIMFITNLFHWNLSSIHQKGYQNAAVTISPRTIDLILKLSVIDFIVMNSVMPLHKITV